MDVQPDKTLKATLRVTATEDTGLPERTYSWYLNPTEKKVNREDDGTFTDTLVASAVNKNELDVVEAEDAGWYYVHIDSVLNRKNQEAISKVCRVVEHTKAPVLLKMEYKKWSQEMRALTDKDAVEAAFAQVTDWSVPYDSTKPDEKFEPTSGVADRGDIIRLRITTDLDDAILDKKGLKADSLKYRWFVITPDNENPRELDISDIDYTGNGFIPYEDKYTHLGERQIDIRCLENDWKCRFFCVVENTLAGEMNDLEQTDYPVVFQVW